MNNIADMFVGVDVSQSTLDISFYPTKQHFRVSNDKSGLDEMVRKLKKHSIVRIACESSGGYERLMLRHLRTAKYEVILLDPKIVRYFILSKKIKAKTDKIDAYMIAMFTAHNEPEYNQVLMSENHEALRDMVRRRADTIEYASCEKKRLKQSVSERSDAFIKAHIEYLESQLKLIDMEIKLLINGSKQWLMDIKILKSMPGIGDISAVTLLAEMPELGRIENKKVASLLGVAPHTKQSGMYVGKATIGGGRFIPRKVLYMAALSACHGKSKFKDFYENLKRKGKKSKMCLVALMNKMITTANALMRKGEMWNKNYGFNT